MSDDPAYDENKAIALVKWIADKAIKGIPPLSSATNLAQEYLLDKSYIGNDARADALVRWETSKNFTSGFLTGLGGIITLPVAIPSALGAAWVIQARMAGAIAVIYGHSLEEDRVRTLVLLSLAGDAAKEILKDVGIQIGRQALEQFLMKIPGRLLIEINKRVGFRLLTKAGEEGIVNLIKIVPIAGGIVGGFVDASMCYGVGRIAITLFRPQDDGGDGCAVAVPVSPPSGSDHAQNI